MVTEVKMEVTPDLSTRIQEIVLANGGRRNPPTGDIKYLLINCEKCIIYTDEERFKRSYFKEVSPYDFIASQGQQEWLPKYGEEAMFNEYDEKTWVKDTFIGYGPKLTYPYWCNNRGYRNCKPISKKISFIQFLKNNIAYNRYMNNIKIENQRWDEIDDYIELENLQKRHPDSWLIEAFYWDRQQEYKGQFWHNLHGKWKKLLEQNSDANIVWGE